MSGKKCISMRKMPSPWQASQRPPLHVERIAPRLVAARLRLRQRREQIANVREDAGVRRRVRARRAADRRLVDVDDLVDVLRARRGCRARPAATWRDAAAASAPASSVSITSDDLPEPDTPVTHVSTPTGKRTDRLCRLCARAPLTVIQLVGRLAPLARRLDAACGPTRYAPVSDAVERHDVFGRARRDDAPAVHAGARPHVEDVIGRA